MAGILAYLPLACYARILSNRYKTKQHSNSHKTVVTLYSDKKIAHPAVEMRYLIKMSGISHAISNLTHLQPLPSQNKADAPHLETQPALNSRS